MLLNPDHHGALDRYSIDQAQSVRETLHNEYSATENATMNTIETS